MCNDGFTLDEDKKGCTSYSDNNYPNCVAWYNNGGTYECMRCQNGYFFSAENPSINPC